MTTENKPAVGNPPTVSGYEIDLARAKQLQARMSKGPAEDARLIEALRTRLAELAQAEYVDSLTEDGCVADPAYLGDRVASAILTAFHAVRVHRFSERDGIIWPGVFPGIPISAQVVLATKPEKQP